MARGRLYVLSGPAGSGKTELMKELRRREPGIHYAITATTRAPRAGERPGVDYFFYAEPEFRELISQGAFVEYAQVPPETGHLYGSPRSEVTEPMERGQDVFVQLDVQGARRIRALIPDAILIFLKPPDVETLRTRLIRRGTETTPDMERRLANAIAELACEGEFSFVVVNKDDQLAAAVDRVQEIVRQGRAGGSREVGDAVGDGSR